MNLRKLCLLAVPVVVFACSPGESPGVGGTEGQKKEEAKEAKGEKEGTNDFRKIGYGGPAPPSGTHRYYFKLYALDAKLDLKPGAKKDDVLGAMKGRVLAEGSLMGKYKR
jgi:Raf kinase inhibitor-like YbhB/YbcL family protein